MQEHGMFEEPMVGGRCDHYVRMQEEECQGMRGDI